MKEILIREEVYLNGNRGERMGIDYGPKLGLLINADIGQPYADQFRPFLRAIDELLFGSCINSTTTVPPSTPSNGDAYLLLGSPSGVWTGHANQLAIWSTEITTSGTNTKVPGWEYQTPNPGWFIWDNAAQNFKYFNAGVWSVFTKGVLPYPITFSTSNPGNFSLAHSLGTTPSAVTIEMTSGGQVWFQTPRYDSSNVYLVASDTGLTGTVMVWG